MIEDEVVKSKGLTLMDVEATRRLRSRLRTPEAQGKAERLMDIVGTISHGRGATLGARQLWARMSGTMRRLRRSLHSLLQQARRRGGLAGGAGAAGAVQTSRTQPPHELRCSTACSAVHHSTLLCLPLAPPSAAG